MCTIAEGNAMNLAQSGKHALSTIIRKKYALVIGLSSLGLA